MRCTRHEKRQVVFLPLQCQVNIDVDTRRSRNSNLLRLVFLSGQSESLAAKKSFSSPFQSPLTVSTD